MNEYCYKVFRDKFYQETYKVKARTKEIADKKANRFIETSLYYTHAVFDGYNQYLKKSDGVKIKIKLLINKIKKCFTNATIRY